MDDQDYYWTSTWQEDEKESVTELRSGQGVTFTSADDAIEWLMSP